MTTDTDRQEALEVVRALVREAHCRYCDVEKQDPRLDCARDVADSTEAFADLLLAWKQNGRITGLRKGEGFLTRLIEAADSGSVPIVALQIARNTLKYNADALEAEGRKP